MIKVSQQELQNLSPLFQDWEETLIWSVLQGCMGHAWADDPANPKAALLWLGDFLFLGGDWKSPDAEKLAGFIPQDFAADEAIVVPQNSSWQRLVEQAHLGRVKSFSRYALRKEPHVFDQMKLRSFRDNLPDGFTLRAIDEELYRQIQTTPWAQDFCSQFPTWDDYAAHGHGFVALSGKELAAGASSYSWYREGIEIEIDTKSEYRRRGLALCCASALILHCLDQGLYPSWDAANLASVALAEKLGYHFSHEYPCCGVERKGNL